MNFEDVDVELLLHKSLSVSEKQFKTQSLVDLKRIKSNTVENGRFRQVQLFVFSYSRSIVH